MSMHFNDALVVVTGGSRGIGRAIAESFANCGAQVVALSTGKVDYANDRIVAIQADLMDIDQLEASCERIISDHGIPSVLVNNAGVNVHSSFDAMNPEQVETEFRLNAVVPGLFISRFGNAMSKIGSGAIINIGSIKAFEAGNSVGYGASKAALQSMTLSAAQTFGVSGIRVNAVAPGPVDTEMFRELPAEKQALYTSRMALGRVVEPDEVAAAVLFLASDQARAITGATLRVDCGYRL